MDRQVNVGIIGMGYISGTHLKNLSGDPRARVLAVCDIDRAWLEKERTRLQVPYAYTDYRELLINNEIDMVIVCVPTWLHARVTVAALEAGKHVLCEKPMACSADEARAMQAAAERSDKKLMISHNQRFERDIAYLRMLQAQNAFGELYFMRLAWRRPTGMMPAPGHLRGDGTAYNRNWFNERSKGGGVLRDLGSHLIDLAMYITGFPALDSVSASCCRKFYPELLPETLAGHVFDAEDFAAGHIKCKNGMSMQLEVSFGSNIEQETLLTELYGTKAGASRRFDGVKLIRYGNGVSTVETVKRYLSDEANVDGIFLDCVINDTPCPVTPEEGVKVIEVIDALYASGYGCVAP